MKRIITVSLFVALVLSSCGSGYDTSVVYPDPVATTPLGKALLENTGRIACIYKDSTYTIHKGVDVTEFFYLGKDGKTVKTWWMVVDMKEPTLYLQNITPQDKVVGGVTSEPLTTMMLTKEAAGFKIVGGINTDFGSDVTRSPQGAFWVDGICQKNGFNTNDERPRCIFTLGKDKKATIDYVAEYDAIVAGGNIEELFCGSPVLVKDGAKVAIEPNDLDEASHPRTAIGLDSDGTTVTMMVVDGRRYTWSNGMYLDVLADFMLAAGCHSAMNLDGGGSSTIAVRDPAKGADFHVLNWPNDGGGAERPLWNGLAIVVTD